ncbi:glycosyltransferase family 2 protein [Ascidiimonas aurantiaca]|uniref:glycosyltransferase family 2 protein n=1 Tax=Ascidiimonas aurantiaca TaxID=1685432 RepID=UPI0030ED8972
MLLSYIIPVFNNEKYIADCLESIVRQDLYTDQYEVLVIDDGSNDKSSEIVEDYTRQYTNIYLLQQPHTGVGSARNLGLSKSMGDYIYFLDADDYLVGCEMSKIIACASRKNADILRFGSETVAHGPGKKEIRSHTEWQCHDKEPETGLSFLANNHYSSEIWYYIIKRSFLLRTKLCFEPSLFIQDSFYTPALYLKAERTVQVPVSIHRYRKNETSITRLFTKGHLEIFIKSIMHGIARIEELKKTLSGKYSLESACKNRLTVKQQWYTFLLIIRFTRSSLKLHTLMPLLKVLHEYGAYPIQRTGKKPFDRPVHDLLIFVFNRSILLKLFVVSYRFYFRLIK